MRQHRRVNIETQMSCHEIMLLFVLRKFILQMRVRSHTVGLDVWFLVGPFVYFHTSCVRTVKGLVRLHGYAGSPEPSLVAYISTIISWAGSNANEHISVFSERGSGGLTWGNKAVCKIWSDLFLLSPNVLSKISHSGLRICISLFQEILARV